MLFIHKLINLNLGGIIVVICGYKDWITALYSLITSEL